MNNKYIYFFILLILLLSLGMLLQKRMETNSIKKMLGEFYCSLANGKYKEAQLFVDQKITWQDLKKFWDSNLYLTNSTEIQKALVKNIIGSSKTINKGVKYGSHEYLVEWKLFSTDSKSIIRHLVVDKINNKWRIVMIHPYIK